MAAPVLTVFTDAAPCPRVEVFFPSFDVGTVSVTVYRFAGGREFQVRGAVRAATAGALSRVDFEVPFNEPVSYRAEQFDAAGVSLGFTASTTLGDQYTAWVEADRNRFINPLPANTTGFGPTLSTQAISGGGITLTSTTNTSAQVGVRLNWATNGLRPSVTPGETVELSVDVLSAQSRDAALSILFYDASNAYIAGSIVTLSAFANTPSFVRRSLSAVAPVGSASAAFYFANGGTISTGDTITFSKIRFGLPGGSFFDPTAANTPTEQTRFLGATNASISVREVRTFVGTGVSSADSWMHNPLDPQGAVKAVFGDDTAWTITRPTPGVVSHPKGRREGVVLSEPRQGVTGLRVTVRTSSDADADKVQAMAGDDGRPPIVCIRLGGDDKRTRVPQPLFLSALTVDELDMNHRWGGNELAHRFEGDEVAPPIPGLIVPLLRAKDINVSFATALAVNTGHLKAVDVNRRYDLAGAAG